MKKLSYKIKSFIKRNPKLNKFIREKEFGLVLFFGTLIFILVLNLFFIQIVNHNYYESKMFRQHIQKQQLKANRGHIFVTDRANQEIKLTENISLYTIYVDPENIKKKLFYTYKYNKKLKENEKVVFDMTQREKFLQIITPVVYAHLCKYYKFSEPTKTECIKNIESYTNKEILPKKPKVFYYASGIVSKNYYEFDWTGYNKKYQEEIKKFDKKIAMKLIKNKLDSDIVRGERKYNYLGLFENNSFLEELKNKKLDYIFINNGYVYVEYKKIKGIENQVKKELKDILSKYGYKNIVENLPNILEKKKNRYVKIMENANPVIAKTIENLKQKYYKYKTLEKYKIPLLHGIGLEQYTHRYYPYKSFISNIIGYVNKEGEAFHGIEGYYNDILKGIDGKIKGRSSRFMGKIGGNDFNIENGKNGSDIYLTIDPGIQKQIEIIAKDYQEYLRADSVSILVYDPYSGHIKSSVSFPNYNPNNLQDPNFLQPLSPEYDYIIKDETMVDHPVFIDEITGGKRRKATIDEKMNMITKKYIPKNIYGSTVFVDKNIAYPYDPGSIFKAITFGIGLDTNEISRYEFYEDEKNYIEIDLGNGGKRKIENASETCQGTHNFMFALEHSCNVGMVKIVQKITKRTFYNYLKKLGFGRPTGIELAGEEGGFVNETTSVSKSRFLNNSFGLGILVTPLQMAVAYGSLVNSGKLLKPTVVSKICNGKKCIKNKTIVRRQVFSPELSKKMIESFVRVAEAKENAEFVEIPGYSIGGKSGTSSIVYKGKYMDGKGWTNASYAGIITKDNLKYIVIVQVRRPRLDERGTKTAGKVFKEVAKFLINYELIDS